MTPAQKPPGESLQGAGVQRTRGAGHPPAQQAPGAIIPTQGSKKPGAGVGGAGLGQPGPDGAAGCAGPGLCCSEISHWKASFFSSFPPLNKQNPNMGVHATELLCKNAGRQTERGVARVTGFLPREGGLQLGGGCCQVHPESARHRRKDRDRGAGRQTDNHGDGNRPPRLMASASSQERRGSLTGISVAGPFFQNE